MDSRKLDWKLARVTGSNMVDIRDVTVSSERHFNSFAALHSKVTKLWSFFCRSGTKTIWPELLY